MSEPTARYELDADLAPDISKLVTEDEAPMDNFASEKLQRLLTSTLYESWRAPDGVPFLAAANVGIYTSVHKPAIVPDVLVSLDVTVPEDWWDKRNRCYLSWEFGKLPELAIEIVSDRNGLELSAKLRQYARIGVLYYIVFDPALQLSDTVLQCFELRAGEYELLDRPFFDKLGLGLTLWRGSFEGREDTWLRWVGRDQVLLPTGAERAESERARAESERARAESERARAESERARAERLAAKLRALGVDPDES